MPPRAKASPDALLRAVRLSLIPGVTLADACRTTGVSIAALRRARKESRPSVTRDDLILAALTQNGARTEGDVGALAALASWLDYVNHDGSTAEEVERDLTRLASGGRIALEGSRFRLLQPWP